MAKTGKTLQDYYPSALPPTQTEVVLDPKGAALVYANHCQVSGTPEELVVDLALNAQVGSVPSQAVKVSHRVVVNYFTAKRLLGALHAALQQHERVFGVVEMDVQKRQRRLPGFDTV